VIYLAKFPRLNKLDLRVEAVNTDPPITNSNGRRFIYWEGIHRDLYLNKGNLLGNWIGHEGKGIQAWSTYWLNGCANIQLVYRHATIAKDFVPGGESNDASISGTLPETKPGDEGVRAVRALEFSGAFYHPTIQCNRGCPTYLLAERITLGALTNSGVRGGECAIESCWPVTF
jgi:hypothetical protein